MSLDSVSLQSEVTLGIQSKLHLKIQLVYVTSFQYLVMLYQEEMLKMERKLHSLHSDGLPTSSSGKQVSIYTKLFGVSDSATPTESTTDGDRECSSGYGVSAEEFGAYPEMPINEIEDECMVWYCSCVNDIWRACSHHFVRQKLSKSLPVQPRSDNSRNESFSGMSSIEEEGEEEYEEWDGVGIVGDEIRKIEREFSKTMRAGLQVIVNRMYSHLGDLLDLPNLKTEWISWVAAQVITNHGVADRVDPSILPSLSSSLLSLMAIQLRSV